MSQSWNLLNYPTLHQQRRRRHRAITTLAGLVVGALLAAATLKGLEGSLQHLRLQQAQLQAQWLKVSQERKREQQQVAAREAHRQQALFLQQITQQHQAWAALYEVMLSQVDHAAWRLSRLQLESGKLELVGWSRDFEHLNATRGKLMTHLQSHLPEPLPSSLAPQDLVRQTSVVSRVDPGHGGALDAKGVEFVWVSRWPVLQPSSPPAQKTGSGDRP
jgi:hypothetical protein